MLDCQSVKMLRLTSKTLCGKSPVLVVNRTEDLYNRSIRFIRFVIYKNQPIYKQIPHIIKNFYITLENVEFDFICRAEAVFISPNINNVSILHKIDKHIKGFTKLVCNLDITLSEYTFAENLKHLEAIYVIDQIYDMDYIECYAIENSRAHLKELHCNILSVYDNKKNIDVVYIHYIKSNFTCLFKHFNTLILQDFCDYSGTRLLTFNDISHLKFLNCDERFIKGLDTNDIPVEVIE